MNLYITQLDRTSADDVVITAHWVATMTTDGVDARVIGTCGFNQRDPSDPNFVPFDDITEETVIEWIKDTIDEEDNIKMGDKIKNMLEAQIAVRKSALKKSGVPQ